MKNELLSEVHQYCYIKEIEAIANIKILEAKLAECLYTIRNIETINCEKERYKIARKTLEVYSLFAGMLRMNELKNELQDLAFKAIHPSVYQSITDKKNKLTNNDADQFISSVVADIQKLLLTHNINGKVSGREKSNYSIWLKMMDKNTSFDNICDVIGFRIIVKDISDCYKVLDIMHQYYHPVSGTFCDYISSPKINGYKSIHTTVIWSDKCKVEIQIRTEVMHSDAEYGNACHWTYKQKYDQSNKLYSFVQESINTILNSTVSETMT